MPKRNILNVLVCCVLGLSITGCTIFRYTIVPQNNKGPHGGALTFIDQRVPDYVEFVAIPGEKDWVFQIFIYDKNLRQRDICGSGYLTIELPDGTNKGVDLWNAKAYAWSKGKGYLENKLQLNDVKEFLAKVSIRRGRNVDQLMFNYPYS